MKRDAPPRLISRAMRGIEVQSTYAHQMLPEAEEGSEDSAIIHPSGRFGCSNVPGAALHRDDGVDPSTVFVVFRVKGTVSKVGNVLFTVDVVEILGKNGFV